jgi:uncharacterized protein (TIGR03083 family)
MSERKAAISRALQEARAELQRVLNGLSEADWQRPTACEGWAIKDVVSHIGNGEAGNLLIGRRILSGEDVVVEGFDLNRFNQRQVEKRRAMSVAELLDDLSSARQATLALLDELTDAQLDKRGVRTTGEETTVEQVFYQIARHDQMHLEHIRGALG